jgi:hypothetical protein
MVSRVTTYLRINAFSLQRNRHSHSWGKLQRNRGELLLGSVWRVKGKSALNCDRVLVNFCAALFQ